MTSIYEHVLAHVNPHGPGVVSEGEDLPDEERPDSAIKFAPGMMDGIVVHHLNGEEPSTASPSLLADRILAAAHELAEGHPIDQLVSAMTEEFDLDLLDDALEEVAGRGPSRASILELGRTLAMNSSQRVPVKIGIALIGLAGDDSYREVLLTLGRHSEFTLFVGVALARTVPPDDRDGVLLELASVTDGWGRVSLIERLLYSRSERVRRWLLTSATRGSMLAGMYTALPIAENANLAEALSADTIDEDLFDGATDILWGLLDGLGPAGDISDYGEAPLALTSWLRHAALRPPNLRTWGCLEEIEKLGSGRWLLAGDDLPSEWSQAFLDEIAEQSAALLGCSEWYPVILDALNTPERVTPVSAGAARRHGIDPFGYMWPLILENPADSHYWGTIGPDITQERLPEYLRVGREVLSHSLIRRADQEYSIEDILTWMKPEGILQDILRVLERFPGQGIDFVELALKAYTPALRIDALRTLRRWGRPAIPPDTWNLLADVRASESDEHVLRVFDGLE